jgi:hypothetical protein
MRLMRAPAAHVIFATLIQKQFPRPLSERRGFHRKGMPIARFKGIPSALFGFAFCLRKGKPFSEGHWRVSGLKFDYDYNLGGIQRCAV